MATMTPDRWARIEPLYHAARARAPSERAAFLATACNGDDDLRRDVESLLNEAVSDEGFLDAPAVELAARLFAGEKSASMIGRSLGAYRLERLIGAGGMGEVYEACDTKLGRDVAIKILPQAFTRHPDRLARLEREARMLAALNHPNICAIYGLEEDDGVRFLILELVGGDTLADRLADVSRRRSHDSGLPVSEALALARQIAEALEFAHDKGIIHRDLKPANIKITPEGVVKVLDFGLAKGVAGAGSNPDLTASPSETSDAPTAGAVVGTAAYMSPEQACGKPVDRRTDIWAFGAVLFEMLTGARPFAGDSTSETLASVLKTEPDWNALPQVVPTDLRRLLGRCLIKDPKRRLQSIGDARVQIDDLLSGAAEDAAVQLGAPRRRRWPTVVGITVVALSLALAGAVWMNRNVGPSSVEELLSRATVQPITEFEGANLDASLSPDGKFVSFLSDRDGQFHVWLKRIGAGTARDVTSGQADQRNPGPFRSAGFSGDGSEIWINGTPGISPGEPRRRLQLVPLMGGAPTVFLGDRTANVAWSPDATRLAYFNIEEGDPIYAADGSGGNAELLYRGIKRDHNHFLTWSTDSRWIYFACAIQSVSEYGICRVPSSGHTDRPTVLTASTNAVRYLTAMDDRTLLFVSPDEDRSGPWLWIFDVDRKTAHRVSSGLDLERYLSVASDAAARRLVVTVAKSSASLWSVPILDRPAEERDVTPYPVPGVRASTPRFAGGSLFYLAPSGPGDGLWSVRPGSPAGEIWRGFDGALVESPSISSNGDQVAVVIRKHAKLQIVLVRTDGAHHKSLAGSIDVRGTSAWSPTGEWIVTGGTDEHGEGLFKIRVADGTYTRLLSGPAFNPVWSPDGTTIVYEGEQSAVAPLRACRPDGSAVTTFPAISVTAGGRGRSRFLPDGRLIYMQVPVGSLNFFDLDLATSKSRPLVHLQSSATVNTFDITPDGKRIVFDRVREQSEIRLIDLPKK